MSKNTKVFARLMSVMLLIAMLIPLASCKDNSSSTGDGKDNFDLDGFTLTVLSNEPYDASTPTDLMSIEEAKGDTIKESVLSRNAKAKAKYGLDVEQTYLATDSSIVQEVVRFTAAQDDAYKCCTVDASGCVQYIEQGIFNNVNNLPNINFDADYWRDEEMDKLAINGFAVSLIGDILFSEYESMSVLMYNTPLANDYGMENLYDVTNAGGWTYDRMKTEMEKVVTDLNNDGGYDTRDRIGLLYTSNNVITAYQAADVLFVDKDSNGDFVFNGVGNERALVTTEKMQNLIHNKGYAMDWLVMVDAVNTIISMIESKNVLFQWTVSTALRRYFRDIKTDFGILPLPKLNEEQKNYAVIGSSGSLEIPTSNLELDKTGAALEVLASESTDFPNIYFHVCLESKFTRDEESIEMIMLSYENAFIEPLIYYNFGGFASALEAVINNNRNYNSVLDNFVDAIDEDMIEISGIEIR